jgi:hypothetical protein
MKPPATPQIQRQILLADKNVIKKHDTSKA